MCSYRQLNTGAGVMCGWCLACCTGVIPTLYGKVPRLILRKTSRLTQAVVFFQSHFLCGALLYNCSSAEREGLSKHCTMGIFSRILHAQHPVTKNLHIPPGFSPTIFYRDANSVLLLAHLCYKLLVMRA